MPFVRHHTKFILWGILTAYWGAGYLSCHKPPMMETSTLAQKLFQGLSTHMKIPEHYFPPADELYESFVERLLIINEENVIQAPERKIRHLATSIAIQYLNRRKLGIEDARQKLANCSFSTYQSQGSIDELDRLTINHELGMIYGLCPNPVQLPVCFIRLSSQNQVLFVGNDDHIWYGPDLLGMILATFEWALSVDLPE